MILSLRESPADAMSKESSIFGAKIKEPPSLWANEIGFAAKGGAIPFYDGSDPPQKPYGEPGALIQYSNVLTKK